MTMISDQVRGTGVRFGFGGLARADDANLPVPADLVLAQNARLGSTSSWLSRSFYKGISSLNFSDEVQRLRNRLAFWAAQPEAVLLAQRDALRKLLRIDLTAKANFSARSSPN
jgi:hypothetical protein